jgi:hypothetical protein
VSTTSVKIIDDNSNERDISNYEFESGSSGDVYVGYISYRWILETPIAFDEINPISSDYTVEIIYTVSSSGEGAFNLDDFSWVGYYQAASPGERSAFGHSTGSDKQTVIFTEIPNADAQAVIAVEDTPLTITLTGSDPEGSDLTFAVVTSPVNGSLGTITPLTATSALVTYTPNGNFNGSDSFTFQVNDGSVDSNIATVSITVNPINDAPVANAGPDQSALVNDMVTLDGSGSSDADGHLLNLNFIWFFVSVPADSAAELEITDPVYPTFVLDVPGTYVVKLIVNDENLDSEPDTVRITTYNPEAGISPAINLLLLD